MRDSPDVDIWLPVVVEVKDFQDVSACCIPIVYEKLGLMVDPTTIAAAEVVPNMVCLHHLVILDAVLVLI
jgi:hypothetical protein